MVGGRQRGLSLIELMVVVALTLILGLLGTSLTRAWMDQSAVRQSQALLHQAMAELKAQALRNPLGLPMGQAVAVLLSQPAPAGMGSQLCVHAGMPNHRSCAGARWRSSPPARIRLNEQEDACVAMDSAGQLQASVLGTAACTQLLNYQIKRNEEVFDEQLE